MTLPFSALGALIAALFDTTVVPELPAGISADLVFLLAVVAALLISSEDGLVWASVGGLTIDVLTPGRPLGATTLSLLLVVGLAIAAGRLLGQRRRSVAVASVFVLTWALHATLLLVLIVVEGVSPGTFQPRPILISAIINGVLAVPVAIAFGFVARRFALSDRADW